MKQFFIYDAYGAMVGEVKESLTELINNLPEPIRSKAPNYMVQEVNLEKVQYNQSQPLADVLDAFDKGEQPEDLDFF